MKLACKKSVLVLAALSAVLAAASYGAYWWQTGRENVRFATSTRRSSLPPERRRGPPGRGRFSYRPAFLAAASYGAYWWQTGRFLQTTDDAYVGGDISAISRGPPGRGRFSYRPASWLASL
jgi:multidrug resistance efflux pump